MRFLGVTLTAVRAIAPKPVAGGLPQGPFTWTSIFLQGGTHLRRKQNLNHGVPGAGLFLGRRAFRNHSRAESRSQPRPGDISNERPGRLYGRFVHWRREPASADRQTSARPRRGSPRRPGSRRVALCSGRRGQPASLVVCRGLFGVEVERVDDALNPPNASGDLPSARLLVGRHDGAAQVDDPSGAQDPEPGQTDGAQAVRGQPRRLACRSARCA